MSKTSKASVTFSEEQLSQIRDIISRYADEHPDENIASSETGTAIRDLIVEELKLDCNPIALAKDVKAIIIELFPDAKATSKGKTVKRDVGEDPSASEDGKGKSKKGKGKGKSSKKKSSSDDDDDNDSDDEDDKKKKKGKGKGKGKSSRPDADDNVSSDSNAITVRTNSLNCKSHCIKVDGMPYNADAEQIETPFAEDAPIEKVLKNLTTALAPSYAKDIIKRTNDYLADLRKLHKKHALKAPKAEEGKRAPKPKKQVFKYVAKDKKVTYIDPTENKQAKLSQKDAAPIVDYQQYLEKVATAMKPKKTKKSDKAEGEAASSTIDEDPTQFIDVLCSGLINTKSVLNTAAVKKLIGSDSTLVKPFGLFFDDESINDEVITKLIPKNKETLDLQYVLMFNDIAKIPTSKIDAVSKNIYMHRGKVINLLKTKDKSFLWNQARSNILSLTDDKIDSDQRSVSAKYKDFIKPEDKAIIHTWQQILSSRYVYAIVMLGVPANSLFDKAFIKLITHQTSIRLFMTALYPIAFLFTPFHCFVDEAITGSSFEGSSMLAYNKNIKAAINVFITADGFKPENKNWIHYTLVAKEKSNLTVKLLGPYIDNKAAVKPKAEKAATGSSNASDALKTKGAVDSDDDTDGKKSEPEEQSDKEEAEEQSDKDDSENNEEEDDN